MPLPADITIFESSNCGPVFSSICISNTSIEFSLSVIMFVSKLSVNCISFCSNDFGLTRSNLTSEVIVALYSLSPPLIKLIVVNSLLLISKLVTFETGLVLKSIDKKAIMSLPM